MWNSLPPGATVLPDAQCPECKGRGYVAVGNGVSKECVCFIRAYAKAYLTPFYATAKYVYVKDQEIPRLESAKRVLFDNTSVVDFQSTVKTYLIDTGLKLPHTTRSAFEIVMAYVDNGGNADVPISFLGLRTVPFLIVYFHNDPKNSSYSQVLCNLLNSRALNNVTTWVHSLHPVRNSVFTNLYGDLLSSFLFDKNNGFVVMKPIREK
jgi:hypothetical protein